MSTGEIAKQEQPRVPTAASSRGVALQSLDDMYRFAKYVSSAGMAPKGLEKPESIVVALQMGMELGLSPMQAIQNVAVINGRPVIWGDAMLAVCRASGVFDEAVFEEIVSGEGDSMKATCTVGRIGGKPRSETFSAADAKRANLWAKAGPWQQYPQRMLKMRARGFALRDTFADYLKGIRSAEEAQDEITEILANSTLREVPSNQAARVTAAAERLAQQPPAAEPHPVLAQIAALTTLAPEATDVIEAAINAEPESGRERLFDALAARCTELMPT